MVVVVGHKVHFDDSNTDRYTEDGHNMDPGFLGNRVDFGHAWEPAWECASEEVKEPA